MLVRRTDQGFTEVTLEQRCDRGEGSSLSPSAERVAKALRWVPARGVEGREEAVGLAQW